jgi:hypothetical protein
MLGKLGTYQDYRITSSFRFSGENVQSQLEEVVEPVFVPRRVNVMSYSEFTLEEVERRLGIVTQEADLFPNSPPVTVPDWLPAMLARGTRMAMVSEKSRSEFIVVPILLAARELSGDQFAIYSGQRLDVDPEKGLMGECDFILAATSPVPLLRAPLVTIVEAKKNDIEGGLGQCVAQMVGARIFNERAGKNSASVFGCVTTGEAWQFLRLESAAVSIDRARYYIDNVGAILAVLKTIIGKCPAQV